MKKLKILEIFRFLEKLKTSCFNEIPSESLNLEWSFILRFSGHRKIHDDRKIFRFEIAPSRLQIKK